MKNQFSSSSINKMIQNKSVELMASVSLSLPAHQIFHFISFIVSQFLLEPGLDFHLSLQPLLFTDLYFLSQEIVYLSITLSLSLFL